MSRLYFLTTNDTKFLVARKVLKETGINVVRKSGRHKEIQADTLEEVVKAALETVKISPVIIEDSGIFISALHGFPGVYTSYVQKTLGAKYMLKLMASEENRGAKFKSVVGFRHEGKIKLFHGEVEGAILKEKRGTRGYGFDMIFRPLEIEKSFAEMSFEEMVQNSDWKKSFESFGKWFTANFTK